MSKPPVNQSTGQKRSIFEEVGETSRGGDVVAPKARGAAEGRLAAVSRGRKLVRGWLIILFVMVVTMIAVGGMTRLTDSGLSITEWKPVTGALPPMSDAVWLEEFAKYQATPQFEIMNSTMTLAEFKGIYWWEWGHRQLGRTIGLVWAIGFFGLWAARQIPKGWHGRLLGIGALGGVQGAIGWWMVASGLTGEMTSVASYRLATHLGLAFAILWLIVWYVLMLSRSSADIIQAKRAGDRKLGGLAAGLLHLAFLQILLGALVAGIDAGRGYTDWPLMGGQILPPDPFSEVPLWRNFFENAALVQFMHRVVGYALAAMAVVAYLKGRRSAMFETRGAFTAASVAIGGQVLLGIATLMHGAPLHLGVAHQLGAVLVMTLVIRARHRALYPLKQSLRATK
jgi:cytochrome c oxidase assembly protein subunit 15